jgi:hypothetical protein
MQKAIDDAIEIKTSNGERGEGYSDYVRPPKVV